MGGEEILLYHKIQFKHTKGEQTPGEQTPFTGEQTPFSNTTQNQSSLRALIIKRTTRVIGTWVIGAEILLR